MSTVASTLPRARPSVFKDIVLPREHGSWSLAFEPMALGLLVAPSIAGALLVVALSAGFFARRPLRISFTEPRADRRRAARGALAVCATVGVLALTGALLLEGFGWLIWLTPVALAGAVFAHFDRRGEGREEAAEIAGSAAFAMVPAALAILGGLSSLQAFALAAVVVGRSVPSVLCVRAFLREKKTGVRSHAPALITACIAVLVTAALSDRALVSPFVFVCTAALALRAFALLVFCRPAWRARTVGMIEAVIGIVFVVGSALTLPI